MAGRRAEGKTAIFRGKYGKPKSETELVEMALIKGRLGVNIFVIRTCSMMRRNWRSILLKRNLP
jgi:hypothetical protein